MSDGLQPKFMVSVSPALLEHACVLGRGGISWKQFVPTWGLKAQACLGLACLFEVISVPGSDRDSSQTLKWGDEQFCDPLHNIHPVSLLQACTRPPAEARPALRFVCVYCQQPGVTGGEGQTWRWKHPCGAKSWYKGLPKSTASAAPPHRCAGSLMGPETGKASRQPPP